MQVQGSTKDPDLVYFDPFLIARAQCNAGLSLTQHAGKAGVALNTVRDAVRGKGLARHTAEPIARALGFKVTELLAPWDVWYRAPIELVGPWGGAAEWEPQEYLNQGRLAPNGLYYIVCRMRHRYTSAKQGRGKFYHLSWLSSAARQALQTQLSKHAEICARVGPHPQIPVNLSSTPVANHEGWWVVDEWVGRETLADRLSRAPIQMDRLPRFLDEIAKGIAVLHSAGVIFRELAPARILIAERDERIVLTDFELARLLDGVPSGNRDWPEDDIYRAPEIDSGLATVQSDLYSFGQVALGAISGQQQVPPKERAGTIAKSGAPKKLQKFLLDCLEPLPSRRPSDITMLLPHLAAWRKR